MELKILGKKNDKEREIFLDLIRDSDGKMEQTKLQELTEIKDEWKELLKDSSMCLRNLALVIQSMNEMVSGIDAIREKIEDLERRMIINSEEKVR